VPGAAIRILLSVEDLRERAVDGLPLRERGIAIERRAHERMAELDSAAEGAHQPCRLCGIESVPLGAQCRGGIEERRQVAGVVGSDQQEQCLRRRRKPARALEIDPLDLRAPRQRLRERRAAAELLRGQDAHELGERQRVPTSALDEPLGDLGREDRRHARGEQCCGRLGAELA
jgi:hypothetical protein